MQFGPRCARVAVDPGKTKSLRAASFRVSFGVVFLFGCAREARGFTAGLRGGANTSEPGISGVFVCPLTGLGASGKFKVEGFEVWAQMPNLRSKGSRF